MICECFIRYNSRFIIGLSLHNFDSMKKHKKIRQAKTEDAHLVAPLIVQAMGKLACDFTGKETIEQAIPLFETLFTKTENQYSHDNTLVFEEKGMILGSITTYDGGKLEEYREKLLKIIRQEYNVKNLSLEDETQADELYIDTLSVSPKAQGKGVGTQLIVAAIEKAKKEGHSHIGLLVERGNPNAKRLYKRLGFSVVGKKSLGNSQYEHMQVLL